MYQIHFLSSQAEAFDGESWKPLPALKAGRSCAASAVHGEHLYVMGGWNGRDALASVERLHFPSKTWAQLPDMAIPRKNAAAVVFQDDILVVGGLRDQQCQTPSIFHSGGWDERSTLRSIERFDTRTGTWSMYPGLLSTPRECASAVCCS